MDLLRRALPSLVSLGLSVGACVPDLDSDESTVRAPRVLAIVADPPEATPGPVQSVRYRALIADGSGLRLDLAPTWFYCLAQKPLAELGPVSPACFRTDSGQLSAFGQGAAAEAPVPASACSLFGPNPPPPVDGKPPGRPVDADESGGYKIPVMLGLSTGTGDQIALYEQRIACGLAGVSPALSLEYGQRYHANTNPSVRELRVLRGDGASEVVAEGAAVEVRAGERIELALAWPACPDVDACGDGVCGPDETRASCAGDCERVLGCGGQERYLHFDREALALVTRRESLRVAWYATAGTYDEERSGIAEGERAPDSANGWQAPATPSDVTLWAVVRDSRGGVGVRQLAVRVR